jgi:hypothetical protein
MSFDPNSAENHSHQNQNASKSLHHAKSLLMKCGKRGDSLYNHLSRIISKAIDEQGDKIIDHFTQFSEQVRHETLLMDENLVEEAYKEPKRLVVAQKLLPQFVNSVQKVSGQEKNDLKVEKPLDAGLKAKEEMKTASMDFLELQGYWNTLGIGFPSDEAFMLSRSIKKVEERSIFQHCQFWGKFFGLNNDYYVVECTLKPETIADQIVSGNLENTTVVHHSSIRFRTETKLKPKTLPLATSKA